MEHIIRILFYDSFIELPGSNQTFGEKQGLPRARQGREKRTCYIMRSQQLCEIAPHERHFCYFDLEKLNIRNVIPTSKLRKTQGSLGLVSAMTEYIYLRHNNDLEMRYSARKRSTKSRENLMCKKPINFW